MFLRALFAVLALPGIVAFGVPLTWMWFQKGLHPTRPFGLFVLAIGVVGLAWCVRDFYARGNGTLAPWAPPQYLVIVGLYRYSRNPMYVSVLLILVGWAIVFSSLALLVYSASVGLAFHLRVVFGEEPWLAERHGENWKEYVSRVPRWLAIPRKS